MPEETEEINGEKEKLEFLKREEIQTMQKDIARLREIETQKERERIAAITPEEKITPASPEKPSFAEATKEKEEIPISFMPRIPKRPSPFQKVLIRAGLVLILFLVVGFFFWFFEIRKPNGLPEEKITPPVATSTEENGEMSALIIPPALILTVATETMEIAAFAELNRSLPQTLSKSFIENDFTRLLIVDINKNKVFGLKEFFAVFNVKTPESFFDKINNDFTLFVYSGNNTNRLGFAVKIKEKEGLDELLKSWEPTIEKDTEEFFRILGKTTAASIPYFKGTTYKSVSFRYLSFPPTNFGICWAVYDNYFLWTSSGESMIKIINKLTQ